MRRTYRETIKITLAIIGAVVGISACALFAAKYHNYSAAVWAVISSVSALFFLYILFSVRRDVQRTIKPTRFMLYMVVGGVGIVAGLSVCIAYFVIGMRGHEKVDAKGSYVVIVWGFMIFKWSLLSLLSAKSYHKNYTLLEDNTRIVST